MVIEDGRIADLDARSAVRLADRSMIPGGIAFPGFINLHNHTINAPLFRGIVDDLPRRAIGESKVYSILMPMGALAMTFLDDDDLEARRRARPARGGKERRNHAGRSVPAAGSARSSIWRGAGACGSTRRPICSRPRRRSATRRSPRAAQGSFEGETGFAAFEQLFARVRQGTAGPDPRDPRAACGRLLRARPPRDRRPRSRASATCSPPSIWRKARARSIASRAERGMSPAALHAIGRPAARRGRVRARHAPHRRGARAGERLRRGDRELRQRVPARRQVAEFCPLQVAWRAGRDSAPMRSAWISSRRCARPASPRSRRSAPATPPPRRTCFTPPRSAAPISCAGRTSAGCERGRDRRHRRGRRAKAHLQPIRDPIRSLVWYASSADVDTVIVDGTPVVRGGRLRGVDEGEIVRKGRARDLAAVGGGEAARPFPRRGGAVQ